MAQILDGKKAAQSLTEKTRVQAEALKQKGVLPTLAIVRVGENLSDLSYERGALKRAEKAGVQVRVQVYEESIEQ